MGWKPSDLPSQVVAKIYDPLFYPKTETFVTIRHLDVVSLADREYAMEAAAYSELHHYQKTNRLINGFVPKFYGTWTINQTNKLFDTAGPQHAEVGAGG